MIERRSPCHDCPFRGKTPAELSEACEGGDPHAAVMLCHESASLDGDAPETRCRGFSDSLEA